MIKRLTALFLAVLALLTFASCGEKQNYADDRASAKLLDSGISALNDGVTYATADAGYLDDYFILPSYVTESVIKFASDTNNLNEFGIFHVEAGRADPLEELLEDYLERSYQKNKTWYDSYMPNETPKLRDAEVETYGNYVAYAIASDKDSELFFDTIEKALRG